MHCSEQISEDQEGFQDYSMITAWVKKKLEKVGNVKLKRSMLEKPINAGI